MSNAKDPGAPSVDGGDMKAALAMKVLQSISTTRALIARSMGTTHDGRRDIYQACGYPGNLGAQDFLSRYQRGDIARRIVDAYPKACWQEDPTIYDTQEQHDTPFQEAMRDLWEEKKLKHYFSKVDRLGGVGRFGVLFLGFDDGNSSNLMNEVTPGANLMFVQAYGEPYAVIGSYEMDPSNPRFGHPRSYTLTSWTGQIPGDSGIVSQTQGSSTNPLITTGCTLSNVHWSRCIHVCEDPDGGEVFGQPRMLAVWNRLQDIETIVSASGEAFWRSGFQRLMFEVEKDSNFGEAERKMFKDSIDEMLFGLKDYIALQGMKTQPVAGQPANPEGIMTSCFWLISACTGIPFRLLTGAEQGELASTKDQDNWNTRVDARRNDHCSSNMLRPFVKRLLQYRCLPPPQGGKFSIEWPTAREETPLAQAQTAVQRMTAAQVYLQGNVEQLIPKKVFLMKELAMEEDEAEECLNDADVAAAQEVMSAQQDAAVATAQHGADTAKAGADHAANIAKASKNEKHAVAMQTAGAGVGLPGKAGQAPGGQGMGGKPKTIKPPADVKGADIPTTPTAPKGPDMKGNGLAVNTPVDVLMPNGIRHLGIIIGKDDKGLALMKVNNSEQIVCLPEMLQE